MGFHLHQNMHGLLVKLILLGIRLWVEAPCFKAFHYRCVIGVGRQHPFSATLIGVLNHLEQGVCLGFSIHHPIGVKDFMTAMFGIGLGEHH